ncbi:MAG: Ldh family oxidoreductase [Sphaerochaetaceae bacterium]|nr:Ldh family oxidoreductase [Sphaerochaetaceae bacterium]MDC7247935.1 Ldh family oxidoreductase [Sphaerochaetaceae bacterium]
MKTHNVNWETLRSQAQQLLMSLDVNEQEALTIADNLVDADLCGVESHGVSRMAIYMKRISSGVVEKKAREIIREEHPSSIAWDGCNSMGMITGTNAMKRCIEKAKETGCCFVAVNHSNHYGMASYYVKMGADAGMVSFSGTNAPPNIAPWGSSKAYVGTNPLAIAVPTHGEPMLLDMAPSVVAMGKVILAAKLGKTIPEGWAQTADGKPTTDPKEGMKGTVLPIGGPKGYGLSLFMDVLCGILSDAEYGPHLNNMWHDFENPQNVGHVFCCIDISKFIDIGTFKDRMMQMVQELKALPKNPGVSEIFIPGEIEQRRRMERKKNGIELADVVFNELKSLCEQYGTQFILEGEMK